MNTNSSSLMDHAVADETSTLGAQISDAAGQLKDKVSDMGRTAANKIDDNRDATAIGLQKAASALHEKAGSLPGGERVASMAHATAETISATADYVRDHSVDRMMADVGTLVKNNPGPCLLAAGAIGFLVGRAFSSSRD